MKTPNRQIISDDQNVAFWWKEGWNDTRSPYINTGVTFPRSGMSFVLSEVI